MELPERALTSHELGAALGRARGEDTAFLSGRVLGSMCTAPHPAALEAWQLFADTNLGDPLINPGVARLEREAIAMLGSLVGAGAEADGLLLSGGSEANITAVRLARDATGRRTVVAPRTAHFSLEKACHALGMELVLTDVTETFEADVDAMAEAVGPDTACVVGIAGNTEFGAVDPIAAIARLGDEAGAWVHVDAAYGGLILPFLEDQAPFGLDVPGVHSVSVDPHKMGRAPVPAGALIVGAGEDLMIGSTETPYVSTHRQASLLSTRPGAAAAGVWAALHAIGREGYRVQAEHAVHLARWFGETVEKKRMRLAREPSLGIVAVATTGASGVRDRLARRGWKVNLTTLVEGIRIVCMPHVTSERLGEFVWELRRELKRATEVPA